MVAREAVTVGEVMAEVRVVEEKAEAMVVDLVADSVEVAMVVELVADSVEVAMGGVQEAGMVVVGSVAARVVA